MLSATVALAAAAVSALLHLRAVYRGPTWQVYCFKPTTTTLLLLAALIPHSTQGPRYQVVIGLGLALSLVGDVFLMLPGDRFLAGLAAFLLAHLAYIAAFTAAVPITTAPLVLAPLLLAGAVLVRVLWPGLGKLRLPVLVYAATILMMVWQAWARWSVFPGTGAVLAALGASLFLVSDSLLALDRFHHPLPGAQALIMSTYVAAQALIALSVGIGTPAA